MEKSELLSGKLKHVSGVYRYKTDICSFSALRVINSCPKLIFWTKKIDYSGKIARILECRLKNLS